MSAHEQRVNQMLHRLDRAYQARVLARDEYRRQRRQLLEALRRAMHETHVHTLRRPAWRPRAEHPGPGRSSRRARAGRCRVLLTGLLLCIALLALGYVMTRAGGMTYFTRYLQGLWHDV